MSRSWCLLRERSFVASETTGSGSHASPGKRLRIFLGADAFFRPGIKLSSSPAFCKLRCRCSSCCCCCRALLDCSREKISPVPAFKFLPHVRPDSVRSKTKFWSWSTPKPYVARVVCSRNPLWLPCQNFVISRETWTF